VINFILAELHYFKNRTDLKLLNGGVPDCKKDEHMTFIWSKVPKVYTTTILNKYMFAASLLNLVVSCWPVIERDMNLAGDSKQAARVRWKRADFPELKFSRKAKKVHRMEMFVIHSGRPVKPSLPCFNTNKDGLSVLRDYLHHQKYSLRM